MFIGNSYSMTVHADNCPAIWKMNPLNFEPFTECYDALSSGYQECELCMGAGLERHYRLNAVKNSIKKKHFASCLICQSERGIQRAHIIPQCDGGVNVMPLCPSCHWNYDHGLLGSNEYRPIIEFVRAKHPELLGYIQDRLT